VVDAEVGGAVTFDGRPDGGRLLGRRGGGELDHCRPCPCRDGVRRDAERGDGGASAGASGWAAWRLLALLCSSASVRSEPINRVSLSNLGNVMVGRCALVQAEQIYGLHGTPPFQNIDRSANLDT
jgi:hypothetical protein